MKKLLLLTVVLFLVTPGQTEAKHDSWSLYKPAKHRKYPPNCRYSRSLGKSYHYLRARCIVYNTFPLGTRDLALSVLRCETGGTYYEKSHNKSGASGYFQVLVGNGGRHLTLRTLQGKRLHLVINAKRLMQGWYNARVAYFLSDRGLNWNEWDCRP